MQVEEAPDILRTRLPYVLADGTSVGESERNARQLKAEFDGFAAGRRILAISLFLGEFLRAAVHYLTASDLWKRRQQFASVRAFHGLLLNGPSNGPRC
jgi:hypothetical protein